MLDHENVGYFTYKLLFGQNLTACLTNQNSFTFRIVHNFGYI